MPVTFSITNSLNNSYMVKFKAWKNGEDGVWITGGVARINQWNDLGTFDVPVDADLVQVFQKAYNNQYTDWNDSYYDDAVKSKQIGPSSLANKTLKVTVLGSDSCSYTVE